MVAVPINNARRVQTERMSGNRFNYAQADTSMVGRAVEGFGQQMAKTAEVWDEINLVRDTTKAKTADTALAKSLAKIGTDYSMLAGTDADEKAADFVKMAAEARALHAADLKTKRASTMFNQSAEIRMSDLEAKIYGHQKTQLKLAEKAALAGQIDQAMTDAVDNYDNPDPEVFAGYEGVVIQGVRQQLANDGIYDEKTIQTETLKQTSALYSRIISEKDARGEPTQALALLDKHKDKISPEVENALRNSLRPRVEGFRASSEVDEILSGSRPTAPISPAAKDTAASTPAATATTAAATSAAASRKLELSRPVSSAVTYTVDGGRYGADRGAKRPAGHLAIDYAGPPGTVVGSAEAGEVTKAYYDNAYGWRVEINHGGGVVTTYSHMQEGIKVKPGDRVTKGQHIGGIGNTGSASEGNHLHYERIVNGRKVNPEGKLDATVGTDVSADPTYDTGEGMALVEARIAANPQYTETYKQALRDAMKSKISDNRAIRAQTEDEIDRGITAYLIENNLLGEIRNINQIPANRLVGAGPETIAKYESLAKSNRERDERERSAALKKEHTMMLAKEVFDYFQLSPKEQMDAPLDILFAKFGSTAAGIRAVTSLSRHQQAIAKGLAANGNKVDTLIRGSLNGPRGKSYKLKSGVDATPKEHAKWAAAYMFVGNHLAKNPDPSKADVDRAVDLAMQTIVTDKGYWWAHEEMTRGEAFEAGKDVVAIPSKDMPSPEIEKVIISDMRAKGIRGPITKGMIAKAYRLGQAESRYSPPKK